MTTGAALVGLIEVLFLGCLGLCFWKRLWLALAVLVSVIVLSNILFLGQERSGITVLELLTTPAGWVSLGGIFLAFPIAVYFNLQARERQEVRGRIRRSRQRTGRE